MEPDRGQSPHQRGPGDAPEEKVPENAPVAVDGVPIPGAGPVYLMLNKPAGVISSTDDPRETTVLSLLPEEYRRRGLFPAGRLDKDAEGLLLLTDDGPLAWGTGPPASPPAWRSWRAGGTRVSPYRRGSITRSSGCWPAAENR